MADFIAGKYYKRRDGQRVYGLGENPLMRGRFIVSWSQGEYSVSMVTGMHYLQMQDNRDLIEEWREPRTASHKCECVLVECDKYVGVQVRIEGSECSKCRIIGRKTVEVSITEGEGL